jgi:hypothetical protein
VIRHLTVDVPATPGGSPGSRRAAPVPHPLRILAVSDEPQSELWGGIDRERFGRLDLLVSCGDLPPGYVSYLEGTLRVPLAYVIGNHDLDAAWRDESSRLLPARPRGAHLVRVGDVDLITLDWPSTDKVRTAGQDRTAWREAIGLWLAATIQRRRPLVVVSHVAPHEAGDSQDIYHRGFRAYRWLAERLRPPLWLHGHTTPASVPERVTHIGPTTCVNVTGAYVIELRATVSESIGVAWDADRGDEDAAGVGGSPAREQPDLGAMEGDRGVRGNDRVARVATRQVD